MNSPPSGAPRQLPQGGSLIHRRSPHMPRRAIHDAKRQSMFHRNISRACKGTIHWIRHPVVRFSPLQKKTRPCGNAAGPIFVFPVPLRSGLLGLLGGALLFLPGLFRLRVRGGDLVLVYQSDDGFLSRIAPTGAQEKRWQEYTDQRSDQSLSHVRLFATP